MGKKLKNKTKAIKKDKKRTLLGSTQEEDITFINMYTRNIGAPKIHNTNTSRHKEINW